MFQNTAKHKYMLIRIIRETAHTWLSIKVVVIIMLCISMYLYMHVCTRLIIYIAGLFPFPYLISIMDEQFSSTGSITVQSYEDYMFFTR